MKKNKLAVKYISLAVCSALLVSCAQPKKTVAWKIVIDPTSIAQQIVQIMTDKAIAKARSLFEEKLQQAMSKAFGGGLMEGMPGFMENALGFTGVGDNIQQYLQITAKQVACQKLGESSDNKINAVANAALCQQQADAAKKAVDKSAAVSSEQSVAAMGKSAGTEGVSANKDHKKTAMDGVQLLVPGKYGEGDKLLVDTINTHSGVVVKSLEDEKEAPKEAVKLSEYLSPAPIPPSGNLINEKYGNVDYQTYLNDISRVLVGTQDLQLYNQAALVKGGYPMQSQIYKKYSRMQLARLTILNSMNPDRIEALQKRFNNFVMIPSDEDLGIEVKQDKEGGGSKATFKQGKGYTTEQLLQLQIRQLQAVNLSLLEINRGSIENNRLLATLVAISEEGNIGSGATVDQTKKLKNSVSSKSSSGSRVGFTTGENQ